MTISSTAPCPAGLLRPLSALNHFGFLTINRRPEGGGSEGEREGSDGGTAGTESPPALTTTTGGGRSSGSPGQ